MRRVFTATNLSIFVVWFAFGATAQTATQSGKPLIIGKACGNSSYGACFPIHARFTAYTGDGQEVLWPVGTHRLLRSVSDNGPLYSVIMSGKEFEIHGFVEMAGEYSVMGDFVVCLVRRTCPERCATSVSSPPQISRELSARTNRWRRFPIALINPRA